MEFKEQKLGAVRVRLSFEELKEVKGIYTYVFNQHMIVLNKNLTVDKQKEVLLKISQEMKNNKFCIIK